MLAVVCVDVEDDEPPPPEDPPLDTVIDTELEIVDLPDLSMA